MVNGDPGPPWLVIGESEIRYSGHLRDEGDPETVGVYLTDSQGRLLQVCDVAFDAEAAAAAAAAGEDNGELTHRGPVVEDRTEEAEAVSGTSVLVQPMLQHVNNPRPLGTADSQRTANPLTKRASR